MKELENLRSYNRKVFKLEDNSCKYIFRTQHCHYKNIFTGKFENIDTTMFFDEITRTFKQNKASYHSEIPEYSDEVIGFRNLYDGKDHQVSARPICKHIKGVLFNNTKDGNYVEYKNAFDEGIDLRIYAYAHGLKEVVVINEKPIEEKNLTFDFEIIVDDKIEFKNKEGISWDKKEDLIFKDKTVKLNHLNNRGSFFRVAQVWDSNFNVKPVDIELFYKEEKLFLRKTVTYDFMKDAVFPVYTDHATSYYSGAGDGYVDARKWVNWTSAWGQSNWDYIHDTDHSSEDFEGSVARYTNGFVENGPYVASGEIRLERGFLPIDTTGATGTITAASIFLWCAQKYDNQNDAYGYITIVKTTQADPTVLALTDYPLCGDAINNPTEGIDSGNRVDITSMDGTDTVYTEFVLNSTGIGWINSSGYTLFGVRQGLDVQDIVPNDGCNGERGIFRSSETTGTANDPYIEITVSAGGSGIDFNGSTQYAKGIRIT